MDNGGGIPASAEPSDAQGRVVFEWMPGGRFLIQRWEVPTPGTRRTASRSSASIQGRETYLQHYFDSRGVARVYEMSLDAGVWRLWRGSADFSPLEFSQRFAGTFSDDGKTISWPLGDLRRRRELEARLRPHVHEGRLTAAPGVGAPKMPEAAVR